MICDICGINFFPKSVSSKYCSKPCGMKANNEKQKDYKQRWYLDSVGRDKLLVRTSKERWIHTKYGYVLIKIGNELVYEHRVLAEKALGKPLPKKAIVHHMNSPDDNHGAFKLVICPNQAYHFLLHKKMVEVGYGQDN